MNPGIDPVFDAAAEALVLVDLGDPASLTSLRQRVAEVAALFGASLPDEHPAALLERAMSRLADGDETALGTIESALAACADAAQASPPSEMPLTGDDELLRDFYVRSFEHLDDADERLLELEAEPSDADAVDAVFRAFHTIKGMAGFLALNGVSEHAHATEALLAEPRSTRSPVSEADIQRLFAAVDQMRRLVAHAAAAVLSDGERALLSTVASDEEESASEAESHPAVSSARAGTVRVEEGRLDALLDAIGEMVIAESMVSASIRSGATGAEVEYQVERLDKITRELQQMATSLRMVPLRPTFRRMARLVRDVATASGKHVDLVVVGEDTELDKIVVDRISDPLVHALRNAVDHGIESAAERRSAGKPATGRIELSATHVGGAIHVRVTDDGRGIDLARVLEKAREFGLVAPDETPDEAALLDCVFTPGLSTAQVVTEVSGRGVGMDAVRSAVEELRGRVELQSMPGVGTTLEVRLPLTLAIIDGMILRVGAERYVLPLIAIERSVRPRADEITTVAGRGEMLSLPDGLVPIVRLHRLFSSPGAEPDPTKAVVVIVNENGRRAGLLACELLGQQQTVIKPLGEGLPGQPGLAGAAIMPDGRVGLILDAAGLVSTARRMGGEER